MVRRSRHHGLVRRRLDQGGLRELHGREDRSSLFSRPGSRAPVLSRASQHGLRRRSDPRRQRDSTASREPPGGWNALRRHHLPEGSDRHAAARAHGGAGGLPGRDAHVPRSVSARKRYVAGPRRDSRRLE